MRSYSTLLSRRPFSGTLSGLLSLTLLPPPPILIVLQFQPLNRYAHLFHPSYAYSLSLSVAPLVILLVPLSVARVPTFFLNAHALQPRYPDHSLFTPILKKCTKTVHVICIYVYIYIYIFTKVKNYIFVRCFLI